MKVADEVFKGGFGRVPPSMLWLGNPEAQIWLHLHSSWAKCHDGLLWTCFFVLNQQYDDTIPLSCLSSSAIHPQREKEEPGGWRNKWQNPAQNLFSPPEKSLSLFEENVYFSCPFFKLKSKPIYLYISLCTLWCQKGCKPLHNNNIIPFTNSFFRYLSA